MQVFRARDIAVEAAKQDGNLLPMWIRFIDMPADSLKSLADKTRLHLPVSCFRVQDSSVLLGFGISL